MTSAGLQESFGIAAGRTLRTLAGIHVRESTVERTTEAAGERLVTLLEPGQTFGPRQPGEWHRDQTGPTCA